MEQWANVICREMSGGYYSRNKGRLWKRIFFIPGQRKGLVENEIYILYIAYNYVFK